MFTHPSIIALACLPGGMPLKCSLEGIWLHMYLFSCCLIIWKSNESILNSSLVKLLSVPSMIPLWWKFVELFRPKKSDWLSEWNCKSISYYLRFLHSNNKLLCLLWIYLIEPQKGVYNWEMKEHYKEKSEKCVCLWENYLCSTPLQLIKSSDTSFLQKLYVVRKKSVLLCDYSCSMKASMVVEHCRGSCEKA